MKTNAVNDDCSYYISFALLCYLLNIGKDAIDSCEKTWIAAPVWRAEYKHSAGVLKLFFLVGVIPDACLLTSLLHPL